MGSRLRQFQFTPLREGRRGTRSERGSGTAFQFTPLREGRLDLESKAYRVQISIHAPPRGATSGAMVLFGWHTISIHAPPRGATAYSACSAAGGPFQFTPLREGRLYYLWFAIWIVKFQFTPLREGRRRTSKSGRNSTYFNSRPSARGDVVRFFCTRKEVFQFTPLREGRRVPEAPSAPHRYFNSRPSARGDMIAIFNRQKFVISIHAPPRGATYTVPARHLRRRYFNSRPSARGDPQPDCRKRQQ